MLLSIVAIAFLGAATDKVPASGEGLDAAFQSLKTAEQQKDTALIEKWAVETIHDAAAIVAGAKPEFVKDEDWKGRVEFAKTSATYAEYALSTAALHESDKAKMMELYATLEKEAPNSQYLPTLFSTYAAALEQNGKPGSAFQFAEKAIAKAPSNEDLLLILADGSMNRKQFERSGTFGARLAAVMSTHAKPEGLAAADWDRRRSQLVGRGYYIAGMSYGSIAKYFQADKNLRAALPYLKGDDRLLGPALFTLGVADYNLARATINRGLMKEAIDFSQQASTIAGPYQDQARRNVWAMSKEMNQMTPARR